MFVLKNPNGNTHAKAIGKSRLTEEGVFSKNQSKEDQAAPVNVMTVVVAQKTWGARK